MKPDTFIEAAIERGRKQGVRELTEKERTVYLIAETCAFCAMEGVDLLVDQIEAGRFFGVSDAFAAVGANEVAECLSRIECQLPARDEESFSRANALITEHAGFSYESLKRYVESG